MKNQTTSKINGGMSVTHLARSYGLLERGVGNMIIMVPTPPFTVMLYRRARIVEDYGGGHFTIPSDDAVVTPEDPGRRVRPRQENVHEEPPVIPAEDEIPMDWYNM